MKYLFTHSLYSAALKYRLTHSGYIVRLLSKCSMYYINAHLADEAPLDRVQGYLKVLVRTPACNVELPARIRLPANKFVRTSAGGYRRYTSACTYPQS